MNTDKQQKPINFKPAGAPDTSIIDALAAFGIVYGTKQPRDLAKNPAGAPNNKDIDDLAMLGIVSRTRGS